jgi:hypothetical protein
MTKTDQYRQILRGTNDWDSFLIQESGLPGPRGNLELAQAVAEEGDQALFLRYLALDASQAPQNTPGEFLAFCGVLGLGKLLAAGDLSVLETLQQKANDPRWRTREAVAMALQRWGDVDLPALIEEMRSWSQGSWLEKRAAAAALCEPRLLHQAENTQQVLSLLDRITASILALSDRKNADFQVLRKGMGYCWSVAVAALPEAGKPLMEKWLACPDKDIRRIMIENLKKNRLERMDPEWVHRW